MDIKGFKAWAESKKLSTDGETGRNYSYTFYDSKTQAAWDAWQAKAQAVPDLRDLQERIGGHQYYHDEHGHMIVDMDDVVKEISGFDGWKAQAVPEGFVWVERVKLMQIVGSAAIIEPITRGNPLMSKYKTELDFILSTVRAMIEAQEQKG